MEDRITKEKCFTTTKTTKDFNVERKESFYSILVGWLVLKSENFPFFSDYYSVYYILCVFVFFIRI